MKLVEMDKERKLMSELFFIIMKVGKEKEHTKTNMPFIFVFPQTGTSLYEGPFLMKCWLGKEQ